MGKTVLIKLKGTMQITTRHPESKYGHPVILNDSGTVLDTKDGLFLALQTLGWSRADLAEKTGVSKRTIENYFLDRGKVQVHVLNVLSDALEDIEETE